MRIINAVQEGTIEVDEDVRLSGVGAGGAVVRDGSQLDVRGVLNGTLVVEPGGSVNVAGVVNGALINQGTVSISGVANLSRIENIGRVLVAVGAVWNGKRLNADGTLSQGSESYTVTITDSTPRLELQPNGTFA